MSFHHYQFLESADGSRTYSRGKAVCFTGKEGVFARFLQPNAEADTPFDWRMGPAELNKCTGAESPDTELFFDMEPEGLFARSLCRVVRISGQSMDDETDMVLVMQPVFPPEASVENNQYKHSFTTPSTKGGKTALEAIGLTGGLRRGNYRWVAPKMNIGAAIQPAFERAPVPEAAT